MATSQKKIVEELRYEWKRLWKERLDDKIRAEGVATRDYSSLFVEKGTVIKATKDFKTLNFKEIVDQYHFSNLDRILPPNPQVGGWNKFIKTKVLLNRRQKKNFFSLPLNRKKEKQQPKKGGRGWIHQ